MFDADRLTDEAFGGNTDGAAATAMGSERSSPVGTFYEEEMAESAKKKSPRREHSLLVLMNAEERSAIKEAARIVGSGEGTFLRMAGLREARRLKQATARRVK